MSKLHEILSKKCHKIIIKFSEFRVKDLNACSSILSITPNTVSPKFFFIQSKIKISQKIIASKLTPKYHDKVRLIFLARNLIYIIIVTIIIIIVILFIII